MKQELFKTPEAVSWFDDRFYRLEHQDEIQFYPSVTSILGITDKSFLARWRGDIGNELADKRVNEAKDLGSRLHHAFESLFKGGIILYNPQYKPVYTDGQILEMYQQYQNHLHVFERQEEYYHIYKLKQMLDILKPIYIASEVVVWDDMNKVAGSLDYLWYIKEGEYQINSKMQYFEDGLYLTDLKTGKSVGEAKTQIAKYRAMMNALMPDFYNYEQEGLDLSWVKGGICVHTQASTRTGIAGLSVIQYSPEELNQEADYFDNHLLPVWLKHNQDKQPKVFDLPTAIKL